MVQNCRMLLPESAWKRLLPVWVFPTWRCGWVQPDGLGKLQKLSQVELVPDFSEYGAAMFETFCSIVELKQKNFPGENKKGSMNSGFFVCFKSFNL